MTVSGTSPAISASLGTHFLVHLRRFCPQHPNFGHGVVTQCLTTPFDDDGPHPRQLGRPLLVRRLDREFLVPQGSRFAVLGELFANNSRPIDKQRVDALDIGQSHGGRQRIERTAQRRWRR